MTQRGHGRSRTFFGEPDYALYRDGLSEHCAAAGVSVWGWVLMPNPVHLILVPRDEDGVTDARAMLEHVPNLAERLAAGGLTDLTLWNSSQKT